MNRAPDNAPLLAHGVWALVLVAAALLAGCKSGDRADETDGSRPTGAGDGGDPQGLGEGATIDEATTFLMFQFAELGECGAGALCNYDVKIDWNGKVQVGALRRYFSGNLTAAELKTFVGQALGPPSLAELLAPAPCPRDGLTHDITFEVAPGITVRRDIAGCTGPAMAALREAVRAIARRIISDDYRSPPPLVMTKPLTGARLRLTTRFLWLWRNLDASFTTELTEMIIDVRLGWAVMRTPDGTGSRQWRGLIDFAPLDAIAVSPEVVSVMRKPYACPPPPNLARDEFKIGIHEWAQLRSDVSGCQDGPGHRLRQAVETLFENLKARDGRDGGRPEDAAGDLHD